MRFGSSQAESEAAAYALAAAAAWLYGALPWMGWGLVGGVFRAFVKPPEPSTLRNWLRIALRSSMVGMIVGLTLEDWPPLAGIESIQGLEPVIVTFVGFGSSTFLSLWDRAWRWISDNPWKLLQWVAQRGPYVNHRKRPDDERDREAYDERD